MTLKVTMKHIRFAHAYLISMNATKSAKEAGCAGTHETLKTIGCKTLALPHVQELIAKLQAERLERLVVEQDDVVRELSKIAFSDTGDMFNENGALIEPKKWPENLRRSVQAVEVFKFNSLGVPTDFRVRFWDKNKALQQLGLHLGMFGEKGDGDKPDLKQIEKRWTMEFIDAVPNVPALPKPGTKTNGSLA